ncbi:hypothetical protein E7Z59_11750 [Robertkochia marina]|uniref:Outer membrane porin, OprD family n=2 Tax=Robertkochia marina TaxID=1227945 RepID=A0A4S3LYZ4_9FLAO|nr:hypothetical protein E7Z59_11750 [Robertkochia marina]TRZ44177.1 hypothetical protein D3A96_09565 [Robertkochia marina]
MLKKVLVFCLVLTSVLTWSQETPKKGSAGDLSGQWRTFYMATLNKGELKDFNALGTGGFIKYEHRWHSGFYLGGALYTTVNTGIQDLTDPDAITGRASRYEEGLFNLEDIEEVWTGLLGELYLGYQWNTHEIKVGRMKLKTSFLNPQDGRMIPTLVQGAWYTYRGKKGATYQLGVLDRIAPRSTSKFFNIGESIGLYPVGRDIAGQPSQYGENVRSDFIGIADIAIPVSERLWLQVSDYYVDNVFNSFYVKPRYQISERWTAEAEWLHQNRLNNGGNGIDSLSYFRDKFADVFGARVIYNLKGSSSVSLAYNRITRAGRFLFPREWGREFLFSFQKRERSEGTAGNHALVAYYNTRVEIPSIGTSIQSFWSVGQHWKDDPFDLALNKYAFPSYAHFNADLFFNIKGLKGFRPELLVTYKVANGDYPDNPNYIFNKADMWNFNLVLNYSF